MEKNISENGKAIKWKAMENIKKKKKKYILDFIRMIKEMDLGFIIFQKIHFMLDFGKKGNNMEWGNILIIKLLNMAFGI